MIKTVHLNKDLATIDRALENDAKNPVGERELLKMIVKGISLLVKVVRDIKQNQCKIMREVHKLNLESEEGDEKNHAQS
jgi:hypothetical protein